jgi:hypothetical protein
MSRMVKSGGMAIVVAEEEETMKKESHERCIYNRQSLGDIQLK